MTSTREVLLATVTDLIGRGGFEAVSIREVATAAGVSIGAVQHHFGTKDDLVVAAFEQTVSQIRARLRTIETGPTPRDTMVRALSQLLPLDGGRRREARVHLAFASRASVSADLQPLQRALLKDIRAELAAVIAEIRGDREASYAVRDAALLLAVVDGLALHEVSAPRSLGSRNTEALERAVDLVLGDV